MTSSPFPCAEPGQGNRGILHRGRELVRFHASDLWITCALEFRGGSHEQWRPHHFTWLYFLDGRTTPISTASARTSSAGLTVRRSIPATRRPADVTVGLAAFDPLTLGDRGDVAQVRAREREHLAPVAAKLIVTAARATVGAAV
ncbi:MAG TPA: hypothetical protein VF072_12620 [Thermoleophilaceae bacterium]